VNDETYREGWHIRKEIQIGHLITTVIIAGTVGMYVLKLEQRINLIEYQITQQAVRDDRQDMLSRESDGHIRDQLDRINAKLDRVIENNGLLNGRK
jgi:hypothetical protein